MTWSWHDDPAPPPPQGVVGIGQLARRLLERAARSETADALMATASDGLLVLTGPASALPWLDGVLYIAPRPEAPALWLPTAQRPGIALDLLAQAVARRHPDPPWLMLRAPAALVPLNRLLPLGATLAEQIRRRWAA
ncbi:hypothetical protein HEP74_04260 [Xanthomonas sp. SS]|uniref:bpX5 domain-containing protein n=1 Tax=Xanthomonas sp. SS TaxID=2724122 RepID=UPI001639CC48|nr:hypothetical protein [Xanthomonas sp. SS]QNH19083.1 hypothetical protein HEP74_04260 [Xanthomonas sp. SS]